MCVGLWADLIVKKGWRTWATLCRPRRFAESLDDRWRDSSRAGGTTVISHDEQTRWAAGVFRIGGSSPAETFGSAGERTL